jgi:diguanylate cyclase (GGDEF)-like protein/PAS domain S-box-containing protein
MKLLNKIWLTSFAVLLIAMLPVGLMSYYTAQQRLQAEVLKTVQTVRDLLMTVRYTYHQRFLASGLPLTDATLGFLPAHAMGSISDDFARFHALGIRFRNVSDRARNPANQADATEIEAIRWFRANPAARERLSKVEEGGVSSYFYATPIRIEGYCLTCHGARADAPATIRERYAAGFDYREGELRGVLSIRVPAAPAEAAVMAALLREQVLQAGGFLLALLAGGLLMQRLVIRRLKSLAGGALTLARGDYSTRLERPDTEEMAELAGAFNTMAAAIQQREAALRESEARWQFALDGSDLGVWDWRNETGRVFFSRRWKAMLGYQEDEIGDSFEDWSSRVHPDDRPRCDAALRQHLQGQTAAYTVDHRLRCKDGRYKWITARGMVVERGDDGEPTRMIGTHTDISQRKETELALAATAEFVSAPAGDDFCQVTVRHAAETLGLDYVHIARLLPGQDRVEVHAAWLDGAPAGTWAYDLADTPCAEVMAKARRCISADVQALYPRDDALRQVHADSYVGEPIIDSRGNVLGLIVGITHAALANPDMVRDNLRILAARTGAEFESRAATAALRAERDRNQRYLDTVQTIMLALDAEGRIVMINRYGQSLLGYREEQLLGRNWFATCLPQPGGIAEVYPVFQRIMAGGLQAAEYFENPILCRDGRERLIAWHNAYFTDADGAIVGSLSSGTDISELRGAETSLRDSEAMFHTMVDWTYDWEYWVRPDGGLRYMTPSVERLTGYRADDFRRNPALINVIVHAEDRAAWQQHVAHHLPECVNDELSELDFRIVRQDGVTRWVNHICRPVLSGDGVYLGRRVSVRDITARMENEERIRQLANFDGLTGLPNRRMLLGRLGQAMAASQRSGEFAALMLLDLDHFKTLNETLGHEVGDRLLIEVARRIVACLRREDSVARLGGDEFVAVLEDLGPDEAGAANQAEAAAEKVRAAFAQPFDLVDGGSQHSTPSIGITLLRGSGTSAEVLLKQAEVALYQAKDAGRDAVRFFNPAMQAAVDWRAAMENALRVAVERGELQLHYQPQVDQASRVIGAEALLRWRRPEFGPVAPAEFIPLAEETGLILPIGQWVLDTACAQISAWRARPETRSLQLAINVSARQFHQADFVEQVRDTLARFDLDPGLLKLELTESVVLHNVDAVVARMEAIKALGVRFSLDDFGTGYSSLSYLKRLPIDQLKIDQSFVRDITDDPGNAAIVRAILAMSRSLGLEVVAEGVETEAQRAYLGEHGCQVFQGYLYGRPMPIADWDRYLASD